ncbi:LysR family transcriptional regulator [Mesorhizobium sp. 10J20-29]
MECLFHVDQDLRNIERRIVSPSSFLAVGSAKMHSIRMLDWNDLRYFLAVARTGSTAAAARQLAVNQSTVVRRIQALEEGVALRLFNRKRDGYGLTLEGEALLPEANAVEAAVQALARRASALDGGFTGTLRVTTAEGMAIGLVPQLLDSFHEAFPGINVILIIEDRYNDLSDGQAEIALRAGPPGNSSLVGKKLSDQSWAVYGSNGYLDRAGRPETSEDLNGHKLIGFEGTLENITPARWLRQVAPNCEIASRSNSVLGISFAAQSGFGLALLPCQIGDADPRLVRVVEPQPELTTGFWILTHLTFISTRKSKPSLRSCPRRSSSTARYCWASISR